MTRPLRLTLIGTAALVALVSLGTFGTDAASDDERFALYDPGAPVDDAADGAVVLVDHGLQMPMGVQPLPDGWTLEQDIATDPQTGEAARQRLDLRGPNGELIRLAGTASYGSMAGVALEQAWQQVAQRALADEVQDLEFGALQPSPSTEASPAFRRTAEKGRQYGFRVEALEAPLRARRGGQPVEGVVLLTHLFSDAMPGAGTVQVAALLSPASRLAETRRAEQQIAATFRPNPEHQARVEQIGQMARQQSAARHEATMASIDANTRAMTAGHQQRMAQIQASGAAHQQRMQARWDAADAQMAGWQAQQATSDERHRQTINGIRGTADVYDPSTGTTYSGVPADAGSYWVDPVQGRVVGADRYSDNPDVYRYERGTNLDDR